MTRTADGRVATRTRGVIDIRHGDARTVLASFDGNVFDAVVTDPPYALRPYPVEVVRTTLGRWCAGDTAYVPVGRGFMDHEWDGFVPPPAVWEQVYRTMKPGAYAAVFAGDRTVGLMECSLRLAGFEIRMPLAWMHGQGMPKAKTEVKPAFEPILLARKPFRGSEKSNRATWGTGLDPDRARIPFTGQADVQESTRKNQHARFGSVTRIGACYGDATMVAPKDYDASAGRWPSNVIVDQHAASELDRQSGVTRSRKGSKRSGKAGDGWGSTAGGTEYDDIGGASRFFYVAKARRSERPSYVGEDGQPVRHPTVKPLALIEHIVALISPPAGTVLDLYAGSGTTGEACLRLGRNAVLIEREDTYLPLIQARIDRSTSCPA